MKGGRLTNLWPPASRATHCVDVCGNTRTAARQATPRGECRVLGDWGHIAAVADRAGDNVHAAASIQAANSHLVIKPHASSTRRHSAAAAAAAAHHDHLATEWLDPACHRVEKVVVRHQPRQHPLTAAAATFTAAAAAIAVRRRI